MAKQIAGSSIRIKTKVKRKGIHAKTKTTKNKSAKLYNKPYNGQG